MFSCRRGVHLKERLEETAKLVRRNAFARVRDFNPQLGLPDCIANTDRDLAFISKFESVVDQIGNHLSKAMTIA